MYLLRAEAEASHFVENLIGGLRPPKRLAVLVVRVDVAEDRLPQLRDARVRAALEGLLGEQPKESLHQIQPRRVRRREMKLDARMPEQPPMDRRRSMSREVVQHDVDLQRGGDARLDLPEERHEILGAMLLFAPRQDFTGRDVERGEQVERAIPDVVMGPPFGLAD